MCGRIVPDDTERYQERFGLAEVPADFLRSRHNVALTQLDLVIRAHDCGRRRLGADRTRRTGRSPKA